MLVAALKFAHIVTGIHGFEFLFGHRGGNFSWKSSRCQRLTVEVGTLLQFFARKNTHDLKRHTPHGHDRPPGLLGIDTQALRHALGQQNRIQFIFRQPATADQDLIKP